MTPFSLRSYSTMRDYEKYWQKQLYYRASFGFKRSLRSSHSFEDQGMMAENHVNCLKPMLLSLRRAFCVRRSLKESGSSELLTFARVLMNLWNGRYIVLGQLVSTNCWNKIPYQSIHFSQTKHVTSKCFFRIFMVICRSR